MAKKRKPRKFDPIAHVKGMARATMGTPPPTRRHSTKKGKKGYVRKRDKIVNENQ